MENFINYFKEKFPNARFFPKRASSINFRVKNSFIKASKNIPRITMKNIKLEEGVVVSPLSIFPLSSTPNDLFIENIFTFVKNTNLPIILNQIVHNYLSNDFQVFRILEIQLHSSFVMVSNIPEFKKITGIYMIRKVIPVEVHYVTEESYKEILNDLFFKDYKIYNPDMTKEDYSVIQMINY